MATSFIQNTDKKWKTANAKVKRSQIRLFENLSFLPHLLFKNQPNRLMRSTLLKYSRNGAEKNHNVKPQTYPFYVSNIQA